MSENMAVIHKQIIKLTRDPVLERQTFQVPIDAEMVEIAWDPREFDGVAFWYKTYVQEEGSRERPTKNWSFYVRATGHAFPEECYHLATVVRDGFALHVLDADGGHIEWAPV